MKKNIFTTLMLFHLLITFGQGEASFWYFGQNAGLQFNETDGSVTGITNGQINTLEGCTSISDENGNLLFYTDGRTVWNRNHQIMANGNYFGGTGLLGDPSSTSSGVIVPKPGDPTQYYIFTVDEPHHENAAVYPNQFTGTYNGGNGGTIPNADDGFNNGFNYSLVDMTLNGGLGDVVSTEKNIELVTYDPTSNLEISYKCSEKITAVRAEDCSSFWVITHFGNNFYAFRVESTGVNTTPVISTVGPNVPIQGYRRNALGYLKASPDATKLIVAHFGFATSPGSDSGGGIYLYDFDSTTGTVSNNLELYSPANGNSPYGVEFSPENRKAYATIGFGVQGAGASQVLQWDLESDNIPSSIQVIHSSNQMSAGALQLGIDRKIYRAQFSFNGANNASRYLGVINNPELDGLATDYNEQGVLLDVNGTNQNTSRIGLPPFIQSLFNSQIDIIRNGISTTELNLCTGDSFTLEADDIPGASYTWTLDNNPITGSSFELEINQPGFYEVLINPNNGDCPIEGSAVVEFFNVPIAFDLTDESQCDDAINDGSVEWDFSAKSSEALNTQDPNSFNVRYFETLEDANLGVNELIFPYNNTSATQTIYTRVEHIENTNCFDINTFTIEVYNTPQIAQLNDIEFCDNDNDITDGIATINLEDIIPIILGAQDENLINITFHTTQEDANNNLNPLPTLYTNSNPDNETIFVRVENNINTECFNTDSFSYTINPSPIVNNITITQCDEDGIPEGFTFFNLTNVISEITEISDNINTTFYFTAEDAQNEENEIENPQNFSNSSGISTLYTRVSNSTTGCSNFGEVILNISSTFANNSVLSLCDTDGVEDGFTSFNLSDANPIILAGAPVTLTVEYYETYFEALLEINPLENTFTNSFAFNQTIFARVENENACYGISELQLNVFNLPEIVLEDEQILCLNNTTDPLIIDAGVIDENPNNFLFEWSTGETTSTIEVTTPGTYTVVVSNTNGCSKTRTVLVEASNIATITDINVVEATNNNSISIFVEGEGNYEYAIDDINGPYQSSNIFTNIQPGFYTVFVRDINNCGIEDQLVSVLGFPKFFTPNNDSVNDFWQVKGLNTNLSPNAQIFIFDKYGKLITKLSPNGGSWDGTYNGNNMPSSDYWFKVELIDGRTFTGHFSLKR